MSDAPTNGSFPPPDIHEADKLYEVFSRLIAKTTHLFYGQEDVSRLFLTAILASGYPLLQGNYGTGKSYFLRLIAHILGLEVTPISPIPHMIDDHPQHYGEQGSLFPLIEDRLFTVKNILFLSTPMVLELSQKLQQFSTQMAKNAARSPEYVFFAATQDTARPIERTPPLYALLDQLTLTIPFEVPDKKTERDIILSTVGIDEVKSRKKTFLKYISQAQNLVRRMPIGEELLAQIHMLVRNLRPLTAKEPTIKNIIAAGPSTRALCDFVMVIRAHALLQGRLVPQRQDMEQLAVATLAHRIIPKGDNTIQTVREAISRCLKDSSI